MLQPTRKQANEKRKKEVDKKETQEQAGLFSYIAPRIDQIIPLNHYNTHLFKQWQGLFFTDTFCETREDEGRNMWGKAEVNPVPPILDPHIPFPSTNSHT